MFMWSSSQMGMHSMLLQGDESMTTSLHSIGLDATDRAGAGGSGAAGQGTGGGRGQGSGRGFHLRRWDGAGRRDAEFELGCEGATGGGGATGSALAGA